MSFPVDVSILTIRVSPNLASHALNVSKSRMGRGVTWFVIKRMIIIMVSNSICISSISMELVKSKLKVVSIIIII